MEPIELEILLEIKEEQGKQRGTLEQILEQAKRTNGTLRDHESRLRVLEQVQNQSAGAAGVRKTIWKRVWSAGERLGYLLAGIIINEWKNGGQ
ncbi:MAG: hypothetical protein JRI54_00125 [Deltaproteobacteria bacterium]|nr:hypothetical protein [Deltaproteobacteria bacterium]